MKKFYLCLCKTLILLGITSLTQAQFAGGTFTTVPAGGDLANPTTWVGGAGGQPPADCNNCQILLFGNCLIANAGIIATNHSLVIIEAGGNLQIGARAEIMDHTEVLVGSDPTTRSTLVLSNAEGDLYGNSFIRLANINCYVDASGGGTNPSDSLDNTPGFPYGGGLFYITGSTTYNILACAFGYGNPVINPGLNTPYGFNCNTGMAPFNACADGIVWGPAISDTVTAPDFSWEFVADATLPVQLLKFAAVLNPNKTVGISWATAQEENSDYFSVQRSTDARTFTEIGRVKAKGFSSITSNYAFTDPSLLNGTAYYRLQIVDLDGKFKYSKVATVSSDVTGNSVLVFSNPFTDQVRLQINISTADKMNLSIMDLLGRSVLKQEFSLQAGSNFINLHPDGALPGVYLLNIKSKTINQTIKLVRQ